MSFFVVVILALVALQAKAQYSAVPVALYYEAL